MMWDGPRQGPRGGGPPFRGDHRGDMFAGRDGPMMDSRNRAGINMMGPMRGGGGGRPQDRPPMDVRRMDGQPDMRGRDMDRDGDMRGREQNRNFFRPGEETDLSRQYVMAIRDKLNSSGFMGGPGRDNMDMGGRGSMQQRDQQEPNNRFMDMRDREMFRNDMQGFNPNMDGRRGFPMGRNDGFRDMRDNRDRPPMDDMDGFNMDMRDRGGMMDLDRRGGPAFNQRGAGFDGDMDFRNRMGSSPDFRGRDRSPLRSGENDVAQMDVRGGRTDNMLLNRSNKLEEGEGTLKEREFPDRDREGSPVDYRGGEEMTLAEEWKNRRAKEARDSLPSSTAMVRGNTLFSRDGLEPGLPSAMGRENSNLGLLKERERPLSEFPGKEIAGFGFPRPDRDLPGSKNWSENDPKGPLLPGMGQLGMGQGLGVGQGPGMRQGPGMGQGLGMGQGSGMGQGLGMGQGSGMGQGPGLPPIGRKDPQDLPFSARGPLANMMHRENDGKRWSGDRDPKQNQNAPNRDARPSYHQEKNSQENLGPPNERQGPNELARFKGIKDGARDQGPERGKSGTGPEFPSNGGEQRKDQDYRDIDYRTGSGRAFDFKGEDLHGAEKLLKETKPVPASKFSGSGSQDQDYRSASVKDKVSHNIAITGIPKTATTEQILGAFAVRDGVPMQGMKIKNVVPGYSYDTAYVEFFNLADAVHFMESNQGLLKVGVKTASMRYAPPDCDAKQALSLQEPGHKGPAGQEPLLASLPEKAKTIQADHQSQTKPGSGGPVVDPVSAGAWQRSSDLTPEAWQQQVDQQLRQQEAEQQAESWAGRGGPRHGAHSADPVFKESKTMIIKNVKPTTTVECILKALDPYAYLDERNVRLVKGKPPGAKCFCFVDMDSHEQVTRLVELLTKPRPLSIDGVRVYAEVAKPLKNQTYKRDDKSTSLLGYPPDASMLEQQQFYSQGLQAAGMPGDLLSGSGDPSLSSAPHMAPNQLAPTHMTLNQLAPNQLVLNQLAPNHMTTGNIAPGHMAPEHMAPGHLAPSQPGYGEPPVMDPSSSFQALGPHVGPPAAAGQPGAESMEAYSYATETPDMTDYLYDATSGFYYDPQTTLYYDPGSRYFYNAQTQDYLYWDSVTKAYIPVPGSSSTSSADTQAVIGQPVAMAADVQAILANPAADAPLEMKKPSEPKPVVAPPPAPPPAPIRAPSPEPPSGPALNPEAPPPLSADRRDDDDARGDKKDKEEKPRSLAAFKIMKDMERWAKIQNRQKESVRSPSPVLKGAHDDRKSSKAADAAFAIFERKAGDDLFKKPLAPPTKKEEKGSKRPMGSLGLLASDYAAGESDEEEEEKHDAPRASGSQTEEKEDKLTDWKKMACLLCRRQFPNKDALVRHQQLSDLHKQNMEIHLKIKRSKKELEALENQEKELSAKEPAKSPEPKKRKHQHQSHQHQQHQHQNSWAGGSRDMHKGSERPGLGSEPPAERKKKEHVVWDHATYKQAVRKAMFARFKELD